MSILCTSDGTSTYSVLLSLEDSGAADAKLSALEPPGGRTELWVAAGTSLSPLSMGLSTQERKLYLPVAAAELQHTAKCFPSYLAGISRITRVKSGIGFFLTKRHIALYF